MNSQAPRLWAPWRGEWIQNQKELNKDAKSKIEKCPFCELPQQVPSKDNLVLYRDDEIFVIMNKFPYNPAHLMVIPIAHVGLPHELEPKVWNKISQALSIVIKCIEDSFEPQGFNMGMNLGQAGGAGIPQHLHWHVLPRWVGDTNFMPLLAETKAINAHNETVYDRLLPFFEDFAEKLSDAMMRSK